MIEQSPPFFHRGPSLLLRALLLILIGTALTVADVRQPYLKPLRNALSIGLVPLEYVARLPVAAADSASDFFATLSSLRAENRMLRARNQALMQRQQTLDSTLTENAALRRLLDLRQRVQPGAIAAEIIYIGNDPFQHKVTIDRGSARGVVAGAPVVDADGVIGQVTRVNTLTSEVTLVTDRAQAVPVQIVRSGMRAVLFGTGSASSLDLPYQPTNVDIRPGDLLTTSGVDGVYPAGLPVARVVAIDRNTGTPFAHIVCRPAGGVERNRVLLVLTIPHDPLLDQVLPVKVEPEAAKPARKKKGRHH